MDTSPFGKLAPELRNTIYQLLIPIGTPIVISVEDKDTPQALQPKLIVTAVALTTTCQQMRAETLPIFYGANSFELRVWSLDIADSTRLKPDNEHPDTASKIADRCRTPALWQWLRQIGAANAKCMRKVNVTLGHWETYNPHQKRAALDLPVTLAPLIELLKATKATCTMEFSLFAHYYKSTFGHLDMHLSLTDYDRAMQQANAPFELDRKKFLNWSWDRNIHLGRYHGQSRRLLEQLLGDIRSAAEHGDRFPI